MSFYLMEERVDELPAEMGVVDGNLLVEAWMEVDNPTKSFIALRNPDSIREGRTYFEIRKNVEEKLLQDLGISSLKDLVGREFVGYGREYKNYKLLEAISPARFDEPEFYETAA